MSMKNDRDGDAGVEPVAGASDAANKVADANRGADRVTDALNRGVDEALRAANEAADAAARAANTAMDLRTGAANAARDRASRAIIQ
jgi:hypothetical protein